MRDYLPRYTNRDIVSARPAKNWVNPRRPYAFVVELEHSMEGRVEDVATIFLTNKECPFRCLMCDLWKNTTDMSVSPGDIPSQIDFALSRLHIAQHIKLYNSGNFFDPKAIPTEDYHAIARRTRTFKTVIVENHPKLCGDECLRFQEMVEGQLEVALGLETVHPEVLDRLNKQMTCDDFQGAVTFLRQNDIQVRAFILLKPPFMEEDEGIEWALRSMKFAFDVGAQCCSVVPTRAGNGIIEQLQASGDFCPPALSSMETVLEVGIGMKRGRVFMDLWDLERFFTCQQCGPKRKARMHQMNLTQQVASPISCDCEMNRQVEHASG